MVSSALPIISYLNWITVTELISFYRKWKWTGHLVRTNLWSKHILSQWPITESRTKSKSQKKNGNSMLGGSRLRQRRMENNGAG